MITKLLRGVASLKVTVVCLALLVVLVLVGTLDQVNLGIYYTVKKYFKSLIVWHAFSESGRLWPVFPGGLAVGIILAVNLITAHIQRFTLSRKKLGIWLIHSSILVLLIGGAISGWVSTESQMALTEGQKSWYSQSLRKTELVVVVPDETGEMARRLTYDLDALNPGDSIQLGPLQMRITEKLANSRVRLIADADRRPADFRGAGHYFSYEPLAIDRRPDGQNFPLVTVALDSASYMLTTHLQPLQQVQTTPAGQPVLIGLQPTRYYFPYSVHLVDFTHQKYPGTTIPSYFSSDVIIKDGDVLLPYHIYMNHPLRYGGITYFQASFDASETVSILQLVKNPVWWVPYISCLVLAIGLIWHSIIMLRRTPS